MTTTITEAIILIEQELFDEECYLDETQQSKLTTLYQQLGRSLTQDEKLLIYNKRIEMMMEYLGEIDEDSLNKKMYFEM